MSSIIYDRLDLHGIIHMSTSAFGHFDIDNYSFAGPIYLDIRSGHFRQKIGRASCRERV